MDIKQIIIDHSQHALYTFISTFILVLGATIKMAGHVEWSTSFWVALVLAAATAAVKEVFAQLAPASLGGRRKRR